ncbi:hypothetical protein C8J56DRAFT_1062422 [Mycena floridula]|nr:hypothetical protein C8J56DRAFT_1062422 [Mycena floridula]
METVQGPYNNIYKRIHHPDGSYIWPPYTRFTDSERTYLNALRVAVLNVDCPDAPLPLNSSDAHLYPRKWIMTTPNSSYIPDPFLRSLRVHAMKDGRFGPADFTICPQIWFRETTHYAFTLRRPNEDALLSQGGLSASNRYAEMAGGVKQQKIWPNSAALCQPIVWYRFDIAIWSLLVSRPCSFSRLIPKEIPGMLGGLGIIQSHPETQAKGSPKPMDGCNNSKSQNCQYVI